MPSRYVETSRLPTAWGEFDMHGFEDIRNNKEHVVLTMGDMSRRALAGDRNSARLLVLEIKALL